MNEENPYDGLPNLLDLAAAVGNISAQAHEMLNAAIGEEESANAQTADPLGLIPAFRALAASLAQHPERIVEAQFEAFQAYMQIWQQAASQWIGLDTSDDATSGAGDRRFKSDDWEANPFFSFMRGVYLVSAKSMFGLVHNAEDIDEKTKAKIEFYVKQYIDALSPTNFALTNPEVLRETVGTGGKNLLQGLKNYLADIDPETGSLKTRMVDKSAFELGRNVATTAGKVVFQNELMQLIQYEPLSESVCKRPLLIIPPWINKFYILDLQEKNSFIRNVVSEGHTVFVISWVNPDASLAHKDFVDYMLEGPVAALDAIEQATGESSVNVIGYCLGGTLLGATLAYLQASGDNRIASATFFTAMLDFSEPGDLGVFIDETQLDSIERMMENQGYLDGKEMATTFNMLRANDLIWSFFINNYLMGKEPLAFDLLFWNSDSTRMPARMHSTYLRKMYLENRLKEPGGIELNGVPIDLSTVDLPIIFISALEDHIAPWRSTFEGAKLFRGDVTFVLSQAGHIAGIVNPPGKRQYGHFTGPAPHGLDAEQWLNSAERSEASWWGLWGEWVAKHGGDKVPARFPGDGELPVIEDAPGSYVKA